MEKPGEQFHREVFARVPAYRRYLESRGCDALSTAFEKLPLTNKKDYLLSYPVRELCWDASLSSCHLIGASSGFSKTGSIFWPKRPEDEGDYLRSLESLLSDHYEIDKRRTLCLVCLAFGTWIGGMQLAAAMRTLAFSRKFPLTVSTPSLNLAEAVSIFLEFGRDYERILWITNPSNISIITALLDRASVTIADGRHFFPVVGEYYTESFRQWVNERYGHSKDCAYSIWTGFGSADAGLIGVETEAVIHARQFVHEHPGCCSEIFGIGSAPMLLEPNGSVRIEVQDGNIIVTKDQLIPLVRYDTGDAGGFVSREQLTAVENFPRALAESLPPSILYVYGRASDAIVFYGTNLLIAEINDYFLSLPEEMRYGGLFEVGSDECEGVVSWKFKIFARRPFPEELDENYYRGLTQFLKSRSLEFNAKYDPLCRSVGRNLIQIELTDVEEQKGKTKHRYIVEA